MEKAKKLPNKINFFNFAKKEVKLNGDFKVSELSRLSEIASNENDKVEVDLKVPFNIAFTRNEFQADSLDDKFEIYLIGDDEELETKDLITDEILLSIPMAPSHDYDCGLKTDKGNIVEEVQEHPFDVLKNIKIADLGKE